MSRNPFATAFELPSEAARANPYARDAPRARVAEGRSLFDGDDAGAGSRRALFQDADEDDVPASAPAPAGSGARAAGPRSLFDDADDDAAAASEADLTGVFGVVPARSSVKRKPKAVAKDSDLFSEADVDTAVLARLGTGAAADAPRPSASAPPVVVQRSLAGVVRGGAGATSELEVDLFDVRETGESVGGVGVGNLADYISAQAASGASARGLFD